MSDHSIWHELHKEPEPEPAWVGRIPFWLCVIILTSLFTIMSVEMKHKQQDELSDLAWDIMAEQYEKKFNESIDLNERMFFRAIQIHAEAMRDMP